MRRASHLAVVSLWTGLILLIATGSSEYSQLRNNLWSRIYLQITFQRETGDFPPAPATHRKAAIWMAQNALVNGEIAQLEERMPFLDNQNAFTQRLSGHLNSIHGQYGEAILTWTKIGDANSLKNLNQTSLIAGNLDLADLTFQALVQVQPFEWVWPYADFLAHTLNDYTAAEILMRASIEKYPRKTESWSYSLGNLLKEQGQWQDAEIAYFAAFKENPKGFWTVLQLGIVSYYIRGIDDAMPWLTLAMEISPDRGEPYYQIGYFLSLEGKYEEADIWLAKALTINPDAQLWYVIRGNNARQAGHLPQALMFYQEGIERFPEFASLYYEMGLTYQLNNQAVEAINAIENALDWMKSPDANYYVRAGSIYEWYGDQKLSLDYYRQALLIDPKNTAALQGVERLSK